MHRSLSQLLAHRAAGTRVNVRRVRRLSNTVQSFSRVGRRPLGTSTYVRRFLAMQQFTPLSEWHAPPVRLEDFVLGAAWQALPFEIQVGVAHIWLSEQEAAQSARLLWTTATVAERTRGERAVGPSVLAPPH